LGYKPLLSANASLHERCLKHSLSAPDLIAQCHPDPQVDTSSSLIKKRFRLLSYEYLHAENEDKFDKKLLVELGLDGP
jgi:hypothetical protein